MKQILESPLIAGTMPQCEVEIDGLFEFLHPKTTCNLVSCEHHFICSKYEGIQKDAILPISQSIFSPLKRYSPSNETKAEMDSKKEAQNGVITGVNEGKKVIVLLKFLADWLLVGNGVAHASCGSFWTKGCLGDHPPMVLPSGIRHQKGLDGHCLGNEGYFQRRVMRCHRPLCPVCWKAWRRRQIARASNRFDVFEKGFNEKERHYLKRCHGTMSLPEKFWSLPQPIMNKMAIKYAKKLGIDGGTIIYHPKRKKKHGVWFYSPHFHLYYYLWRAWIDGKKVDRWSARTGWVFKNLGERPLAKSLSYQLGHAGVPFVRGHVLKWFGSMSYRKLHVEKFHGKIAECPWGHPLDRYVIYMGNGEAPHLPDKDGFSVLLPKDGWMYLPKGGKKGRNKIDFYEDGY